MPARLEGSSPATRIGFDGIDPAAVPAGADIYLGYDDGEWQSYTPLKASHPGKLCVSICVTAAGSARCLDVENGDASPDEAPGWVTRMREAGQPDPWVYMNMTTWPAVKAAFAAQKVAPPLYWVALYVVNPDSPPDIPDGAIGIQYYDYGGYDVSRLAAYIPGLDPAPTPPVQLTEEEDDMWVLRVTGQTAIYGLSGGRLWHIATENDVKAYVDGGAHQATISQAELASIKAGA